MAAPDISGFDRARTIPSSDGLSIATYDLGGDGRDLLLVHATGFCAGVWGPLVEHLRGFRVTAIDVRGHGRSDAPDLGPDGPGMSWAGTGDDVLAAIDALDESAFVDLYTRITGVTPKARTAKTTDAAAKSILRGWRVP